MDEISKAIKGARDAQRERIYRSFSNAQQVSSDDDSIRKSKEVDENPFEKARSGVYSDTAENRRLGRVGQTFGSKKHDESSSSEEHHMQSLGFKYSKTSNKNNWKLYKKGDVSIYVENETGRAMLMKNVNTEEEESERYKSYKNIGKEDIEDFAKSDNDSLNPFEKAAEEADVESLM